MFLKVALICSVFIQFAAAFIAISLIKRTRTHIAWWLISTGFLLMAIRRLLALVQVYDSGHPFTESLLSSWIAVVISLTMIFSLIFVKRIFNIQKRIDNVRKQNESKVLSAIIKTEENERQHFAKELHDGFGPLLSSLKMSLSAINSESKGENVNAILGNAETLIDESILVLKEISNNLSPHLLNNFGLLKAVESFVNKLQVTDKTEIILLSNIKQTRFPFNTEVVFYRIICELLSNSLKYASATLIRIDLHTECNTLYLDYSDDGIGFDPEKTLTDYKGMGYSNIHSRIKSLEGKLNISSHPGQGMNVQISVKI